MLDVKMTRNPQNRFLRRVVRTLDPIDQLVCDHWVAYNLVIILWSVFLIPILYNFERGIIFYLAFAIFVFLGVFEHSKFKVGEMNPRIFLIAERLRNAVLRSFWVLLFVIMGLFSLIAISGVMPIQGSILKFIDYSSFWIILFWSGTWVFSLTIHFANIPVSSALFKLQARARFRIVLNIMLRANQKEIAKSASLFREGLEVSNKFFRKRFDFVIKEPTKFYNYVKVMTCTANPHAIEEIEKGLKKVTNELKKKETDPLAIIEGLKEVISEPISKRKDAVAEVEVEPRLRKWLLANLQFIVAIVEIISLLIVLFGFVMGR